MKLRSYHSSASLMLWSSVLVIFVISVMDFFFAPVSFIWSWERLNYEEMHAFKPLRIHYKYHDCVSNSVIAIKRHMNPHDVKIQHISASSCPNFEPSQLKPNLLSDPGSIQTDAVLQRETGEHLPYILSPSELFADIKDKNMCLMWSLANEHGRERLRSLVWSFFPSCT